VQPTSPKRSWRLEIAGPDSQDLQELFATHASAAGLTADLNRAPSPAEAITCSRLIRPSRVYDVPRASPLFVLRVERAAHDRRDQLVHDSRRQVESLNEIFIFLVD
jgi:hypothetical protein